MSAQGSRKKSSHLKLSRHSREVNNAENETRNISQHDCGRTFRAVEANRSRAEREPLVLYQLKCGLAGGSKRDNYATVSHKINRNVIRIYGS